MIIEAQNLQKQKVDKIRREMKEALENSKQKEKLAINEAISKERTKATIFIQRAIQNTLNQ